MSNPLASSLRNSDPSKLSLPSGVNPNQPIATDALGRTKTLLGHGSEPPPPGASFEMKKPPSGDLTERGWTPAPSPNNDQRIEPAPVVTVLGVPIPRSPSVRPGQPLGARQPNELNSAGYYPSDPSYGNKKPLDSGAGYPGPMTTRGLSPTFPTEPTHEPSQTLQGFRSVEIDGEPTTKDQSGSKRLRPSGRPGPRTSDGGDSARPARGNSPLHHHDPVPFDVPKSEDASSGSTSPKLLNAPNPSASPMGSVHPRRHTAPVPDVESLFYYLDSQVLGLPPPSRSGAALSSAPPSSTQTGNSQSFRRSSRKMAQVRLKRRRMLIVAACVTLAILGSIVVFRLLQKPAISPSMRSPAIPSAK